MMNDEEKANSIAIGILLFVFVVLPALLLSGCAVPRPPTSGSNEEPNARTIIGTIVDIERSYSPEASTCTAAFTVVLDDHPEVVIIYDPRLAVAKVGDTIHMLPTAISRIGDCGTTHYLTKLIVVRDR